MHVSRPGLAIAGALVAAGLVADLPLIRRGHQPISTVVRSSWSARIIATALWLHLVTALPHDPLSALGRWIEGRWHDGTIRVQEVPALPL